ncbi:hypothetical protein RHGRI_009153 [Rhododendron griersonianum]|uniref:Transposase-associated domain-containing protein n=1 Tax=Rhododendron griersonianum TaxID=479676 RepID=A0AAV6L339_9ERIC|nr:hypothetical protein RHGRI_009153 [Rhododendron griersonianum]
MDKSWMQLKDRWCSTYVEGVRDFLRIANNYAGQGGKIRCPYKNCNNVYIRQIYEVKQHLFLHGILEDYSPWIHHGEPSQSRDQNEANELCEEDGRGDRDENTYNDVHEMLDELQTGTFANARAAEGSSSNPPNVPEREVDKFERLLRDAKSSNQTYMASTSIFESSSVEQRWIVQISKILEKDVKVEIDPVSIFRVPATLSALKPKAYMPQVIGLGPYHHLRPELYDMERYKLAAASRLQQEFRSLDFKQLVSELSGLEHRVRACYHKYLDFEGETIAWIMAIDGLFLLDFLRCYNLFPSITTAHLVDSSGRKLAHEAVLGDILMLENQIPIFVLSKILSMQCSSHLEVAEDLFRPSIRTILMEFFRVLSPLKIRDDLILSDEVSEHAHMLDLLYHLIIVPKLLGPVERCNIRYGESEAEKNLSLDSSKFSPVFVYLGSKLWNVGFISKITKPVKKLVSVSGKFISGIPEGIIVSKSIEDIKPENEETKTPKVEEIMIPSVSQLSYAGVQFCPTTGGIATIKFDQRTKKFYLPIISLNVNSEVIMRNLVAYEASIGSESLAFTRYIELMNGIVDTAEDAKLLRENKIIVNSLKSDADVALLFNGMSKCVRLTKVPFIDNTIEDVNKYYYNTRAVRVYRRMKNFVYGSWQLLTILAVALMMLLMGVQSFCSVYICPKLFNTLSSE